MRLQELGVDRGRDGAAAPLLVAMTPAYAPTVRFKLIRCPSSMPASTAGGREAASTAVAGDPRTRIPARSPERIVIVASRAPRPAPSAAW